MKLKSRPLTTSKSSQYNNQVKIQNLTVQINIVSDNQKYSNIPFYVSTHKVEVLKSNHYTKPKHFCALFQQPRNSGVSRIPN